MFILMVPSFKSQNKTFLNVVIVSVRIIIGWFWKTLAVIFLFWKYTLNSQPA